MSNLYLMLLELGVIPTEGTPLTPVMQTQTYAHILMKIYGPVESHCGIKPLLLQIPK